MTATLTTMARRMVAAIEVPAGGVSVPTPAEYRERLESITPTPDQWLNPVSRVGDRATYDTRESYGAAVMVERRAMHEAEERWLDQRYPGWRATSVARIEELCRERLAEKAAARAAEIDAKVGEYAADYPSRKTAADARRVAWEGEIAAAFAALPDELKGRARETGDPRTAARVCEGYLRRQRSR